MMILAATLLTGLFFAGALWVYIFLPRWARLEHPEGIATWYGFGWMVTLGAAVIPTALMWAHL
jgi:hypothetical protein